MEHPEMLPSVPGGRPLSRKAVALGGGHGLFASLSALRDRKSVV